MKILQMTTHLDPGGIPVYVAGLAGGLKRNGHDPVVVSAGGWLEKRLQADGIRHYSLPCRTSAELHPRLWLRVFPRLLRIIRAERPDLLHAHTRIMQVMAWACHQATGTPFVTTCHGLYPFGVGRRFFQCWGRSVMAISDATRDRLVRQYKRVPPHQLSLIWSGVDVDHLGQPPPADEVARFRQRHGVHGDPVLGSIGRLSPVKGLDTFLKAVPPLRVRFPRLQILLVGDGPDRDRLVRLAYELRIADRVILAHSVEDTRVPLALLRVVVASSHREGFGLSLVEAMAAGVPVVSTDAGGPAAILEQGKSGLLIPPKNPPALQKALETLLGDAALRAGIARAAQERAREKYDMKRVVREVEAVYRRAAA